eukprot:6687880-Prymnesium_polylepis.1
MGLGPGSGLRTLAALSSAEQRATARRCTEYRGCGGGFGCSRAHCVNAVACFGLWGCGPVSSPVDRTGGCVACALRAVKKVESSRVARPLLTARSAIPHPHPLPVLLCERCLARKDAPLRVSHTRTHRETPSRTHACVASRLHKGLRKYAIHSSHT